MGASCRDCARGLEHCHGTLILHSGARPDCTDPDCSFPELTLHTFVVDCDVVACECAQPIGSDWLSGSASG